MMDLIERAAAQTELMMKCERYTLARESHGMGHVEWSSDLISVADAMDAIRDLPSAQPEPHYCRECKWSRCHINVDKYGNTETYWHCRNWGGGTDEEGYCYEWERKDEGSD